MLLPLSGILVCLAKCHPVPQRPGLRVFSEAWSHLFLGKIPHSLFFLSCPSYVYTHGSLFHKQVTFLGLSFLFYYALFKGQKNQELVLFILFGSVALRLRIWALETCILFGFLLCSLAL